MIRIFAVVLLGVLYLTPGPSENCPDVTYVRNNSPFSNEVSTTWETFDKRLLWDIPPPEENVRGYRVYVTLASGAIYREYDLLPIQLEISTDLGTTLKNEDYTSGVLYFFKIKAWNCTAPGQTLPSLTAPRFKGELR